MKLDLTFIGMCSWLMLLKQSLSSKLYVWNHVALFHWVVSGRISPSPTNHKSVISNPMSRGYHLITVNQSQVSLIQSLCPLYSLIKGVKWFDLKRLRCDLWDYWNEFNRSLKSVMMRAEIHLPIWNLTNLLLVRTNDRVLIKTWHDSRFQDTDLLFSAPK